MANYSFSPDGLSFEITSKRRKGFPSETRVKKGTRIVHGNKGRKARSQRSLSVRLRPQLLRNAVCAPAVTTVQNAITFFRE